MPIFAELYRAQITLEGVFRYASVSWFHQALATLANCGVHGIAVDVWVSASMLYLLLHS